MEDTLNPAKDYGGVPSIDDEGNLENLIEKVDKVGGFWKTGKADGDLARYLLNILPVTRQNQAAGQLPRKAYASVTYSDKKILEITLENTANTYANYSSMEIALPIEFIKKSNKTAQIDDDSVTVNNFFGHWFRDIDVRRYPDDVRILPTNNSVHIYQYSNVQLKYLPKKAALIFLKNFWYYNKPVYLDRDVDRRPNNDEQIADRSDPNLTERLDKLTDRTFKNFFYRILLVLIVDLGLINFCVKTDTKFLITFSISHMNKLFETNKKIKKQSQFLKHLTP